VKHAEGVAGISADPTLWNRLTPEQHNALLLRLPTQDKMFAPIANPFRCGFAGNQEKITAQLQIVLDILYDSAKGLALKKQNTPFSAPRPKVAISKNAEWNAFAMQWPSRFKFQVNHIPPSASSSDKQEIEQLWKQNEFSDFSVIVGESAGKYALQPFIGGDEALPGNVEELDPILKRQTRFLKRSKAECTWKNWTTTSGNINPECPAWIQGAWLDSNQVVPIIFVNAGMLFETSMEKVIAILAHELGHYLFAHGVTGSFAGGRASPATEEWNEPLGYFYREDEYVKSGVPKPVHEKEVTREARQAIYATLNHEVPEPLSNEKISRTALLALSSSQSLIGTQFEQEQDLKKLFKPGKRDVTSTDLMEFQCRRVAAPHICDKFAATIAALEDPKNLQRRVDYYPALSEALLGFAGKITIRYSDTQKGMRGICKESLQRNPHLCADSLFSWIHVRYPGVRFMSDKIAAALKTKKQATLADWLSAVKVEADSLWISTFKGREFLRANRLGWYNQEQMADDFSLELMSNLGIDPRVGMHLWAAFASQVTEKILSPDLLVQNGYPVASSCVDLAKAGFRNGAGAWLPMRLEKDWNDAHHSFCYRAFNIAREIDLHGYVTDPSRTPPALKEVAAKWPDVQGDAKKIIQELGTCQASPSNSDAMRSFMAR
jgi:hypothetical protein